MLIRIRILISMLMLIRILSLVYPFLENQIGKNLLYSQQCQFYLSCQRHRCQNFNILDSALKFSGKNFSSDLHFGWNGFGSGSAGPGCRSVSGSAKIYRSDRIRVGSTTLIRFSIFRVPEACLRIWALTASSKKKINNFFPIQIVYIWKCKVGCGPKKININIISSYLGFQGIVQFPWLVREKDFFCKKILQVVVLLIWHWKVPGTCMRLVPDPDLGINRWSRIREPRKYWI